MDFLPPKGSHLSGVVDWWDGSALTRDPNFERSRRRRRGALWRPEQDYSLTSRQFPPLWAEIFLSMPATFVAMNPMSRYVPLPGFTQEADAIKNAGRLARRAAYTKLSQADKKALDALAFPTGVPRGLTHEAHSKARQKVVTITQGQLIAQLTLFFWKRLFSPDYEATLWKRSLRQLFPNKGLSRAQISTNLETLYQARNRIAHHEPIMDGRLARVIAAADFLALNFHAKTPSEDAILAKMTAPYRAALKTEAAALTALLATFTVAPPAP